MIVFQGSPSSILIDCSMNSLTTARLVSLLSIFLPISVHSKL